MCFMQVMSRHLRKIKLGKLTILIKEEVCYNIPTGRNSMGVFTKQTFVEKLQEQGYEISDYQLKQYDDYLKLLVEWNEKMNLTAITQENEVYEKHFYDSLLPFLHRDFNNLCDVGAGAGFPSIPVKILYPHLEVTILEPLAKRVRFLEHLCEKLQLKDVNCLHVRAEEYVRDHRECFEIVSARAVANLPVLSELCLPLVKENGLFIAMKGLNAAVEIQAAEHAVKTLGAVLEEQKESMLSDGAKRVNVIYRKVRKTPKQYPRNYGQIKKHPL